LLLKTIFMLFKMIFIGFLMVLILSCARIGTPTGGPKDEKPPISISATPDFRSIHFKENKIKINFDEYIKFKDLNKQLMVSPPLKFNPEITPVGTASKFISIKILDTLKENTTYTFNFGNAITDNSEGNPLKQFKYLFSTGDYIDSLKIAGTIKDAFNEKPDPSITVMLYAVNENFNDSIIYKKKPDYIANTLDSTVFNITNIKEGKYALIALQDKSNNMIFNPKEDKIGFLNGYITAPTDSIYQLILSKETPKMEINTPVEFSKNHIIIGYQGNWKAKINDLSDKNKNKIPFFVQKDYEKDSIHVWHQDIETDSLSMNIEQEGIVKEYKIKLRSKQKDSLNIKTKIKQVLHLNDTLSYFSNIPINRLNSQKINLLDSDSLKVPIQIIEVPNKDKFYIDFIKKPTSNYSLTMLPGAIEDYFGQTNDTIQNSFSTKKIEYYGDLKVKIIANEKSQIIFELLNDKKEIVATQYFKGTQEIVFKLLLPGKYSFRVIFDENENFIWDSGNYLNKIQPEKVLYSTKTIELRANWTINEIFNTEFIEN